MRTKYQSIETQFLPPGSMSGIEEFKDLVINEVENTWKLVREYKKEQAVKHNVSVEDIDIPIPLGVYYLFKDMSIQKALLFPKTQAEKEQQMIALKKQAMMKQQIGAITTCSEPIYGCITADVWVRAAKATPETMNLSDEELNEKLKNAERKSRVIVQFEDAKTKQFDTRVYSVIEPGILVIEDEESKETSKAMSEGANRGIMSTLFDWTPENELDMLDNSTGLQVIQFDLEEAIAFVQQSLK